MNWIGIDAASISERSRVTNRKRMLARPTPTDWPLFERLGSEARLSILSIGVRPAAGEDWNKLAQDECLDWLNISWSQAFADRSDKIVTVSSGTIGNSNPSSRLRARKLGYWAQVESGGRLVPQGDRSEYPLDDDGGDVGFIGAIRSEFGQLRTSLRFTFERDNSATLIVPPTFSTDDAETIYRHAWSRTRNADGEKLSSGPWKYLAPAAVNAGVCLLRAVKSFDHRDALVDIFAAVERLDQLESELVRTSPEGIDMLPD